MVFLAQLQWVNPLSSHTVLVMKGPLLSNRDLFLGWKRGHCGLCPPPAQLGDAVQSLGAWVGDMSVGQGPALTLLATAFPCRF